MVKRIADVLAKKVADADGIDCLVVESSRKQGKNGLYIAGKVRDNTGVMDFKVWSDEEVQGIMGQGCPVILLSTKVDEYQGIPQVSVKQAAPISMERAEAAGVIPASPVPVDILARMLEAVVTAIKTDGKNGFEKIDDVINHLKIRGIWDRFLVYPAAIKHHQAYVRGLFEHSLTVARITGKVLQTYEVHPGSAVVNKGLLLTGALFHDIGKCMEYEVNPIGLAESLTLQGGLSGHLFMGASVMEDAYKHILSFNDLEKLKHIMLSHHGQKEWGAVVEPKTVEAMLVHQADMIDSNFERYTAAGSETGLWRQSVSGNILAPVV